MKAIIFILFSVFFWYSCGAQGMVDSVQLLEDVKVLSADKMKGRKVGTKGNRKAQVYILQRFKEIGLKKLDHTYEQPFFFYRSSSQKVMGTNLMGFISGSKDSSWIVISAHYDHLGVNDSLVRDSIYNGADDNASGVAGMLAIASYFKQHPPTHNLLFIAFDAEEEGLKGSQAFIQQFSELLPKIALNINLDMISHSKSNELYVCGTHQFPNLKLYLKDIKNQSTIHLRYGHDGSNENQENWVLQSDQASFFKLGIPFVYFGVEEHPDYHAVSDSLGSITPSFFYHAVQTIGAATKRLDKYLATKIKAPPRDKWIMNEP